MNNSRQIYNRIKDPTSRQKALIETSKWVMDTYLIMGTEARRATKIANIFVIGLDQDIPESEPTDKLKGDLLNDSIRIDS